ncbi:SdiA-regulated domain-containing protein [uncultured Winogradskyella sp.]|uniref:SdiA-regulated domain-containing protein n=1 Tax=uncultured Winogradskyella sp. TaxID=395353 RepID=UPI0026131945|nr:SdiA-regulated domain-containing protein [uncultured Winogradskyella sp.]|tara:strand:- start:83 stop:961 length:879 start_codon:yes stop_codon:yes gene_type:complete
MKTNKTFNIILILILFTGIALFFLSLKSNRIKQNDGIIESETFHNYNIKNTYKLPKILNEVSGIVWLTYNTFACIQDEDGSIFIYNTENSRITSEIKFASKGDYEAIAINNEDAYVLRSDGLIYEIKQYLSDHPKIFKIVTPFKSHNNMESLTYDKQKNQLLITPKEYDLGKKHIKSIYKIPLLTKQMDSIPIVKIDLKADILKDFKEKKIHETLCPSDIAIHPKTKDIYVLEGRNPKLLILNREGNILNAFELDKHKFAQPEGITFSDDGRLFISNEANDDSANILEVELK